MRRTVGEPSIDRWWWGPTPPIPTGPDSAGGTWRSRRPSDRDLLYQIGALDGVARLHGIRVRYVKPHGALYHRMGGDEACATAVCEAFVAYGGLVLLAPYGSVAVAVAERFGVEVATEAFADRAYLPDGGLVPRSVRSRPDRCRHGGRPGRGLAVEQRVPATDGSWLPVAAASLCIHGDTPGSESLARAVRCCAGPPASVPHPCYPARRCRCSDVAKTSATASCARCSAGSRGSIMRAACARRSPGFWSTT